MSTNPIEAHGHALESVAQTKRFLERWTADVVFRQAFDQNPDEALEQFKLRVNLEKIRPLYDLDAFRAQAARPAPPDVQHYRDFIQWKMEYREQVRREGAPADERFRRWRERQILRSLWELGSGRSRGLVHAPVCFELSQGCTVKCWFCGVGAEPFGGNFDYNPAHAALWRDVLRVVKEVYGEAASYGFCYWATDPLDNPDYEKFISDFHGVLGRLPQTTTAQPLKNIERTKALLRLSKEKSGAVERFSVLSRGIFQRIMEEFTAEELVNVELIAQFNNEVSPKAVAGGSRARVLRRREQGDQGAAAADTEDGGTIACVTGFLFNMVERSVKLISPCTASERWPLGYITFYEFRFTDADDLRRRLEQAIETCMPLCVTRSTRMRFNPYFTVEYNDQGFQLRSRHFTVGFNRFPAGRELGRLIERGDLTAGEIAIARYEQGGIAPRWTFQHLLEMFNQGVIWEEPHQTVVRAEAPPVRIQKHAARV